MPSPQPVGSLPADPLAKDGIRGFAAAFRAGRVSAESVATAYLERIRRLDPALGAYQHVDGARALACARAMDQLLATGTDLGPLMGVPVAIKDIIAVDGTPTTAGSRLDVAALIGGEGTFVRRLRRAGCVILGKVRTTEFALGTLAGVNQVRGTPRNPWDATAHRLPGSSSSGSGVAMAGGLCGFAIGSDTGGSVRIPAAYNGVVGLKTTKGLWPTDGVFPLSPTLDTLSLLCRSADDAAFVFAGLQGIDPPAPAPARGLRLARPNRPFFDDLDAPVRDCVMKAIAALERAGAEIVPVEIPEAEEGAEVYTRLMPAELLAGIGRERFLAERSRMDPVAASRTEGGLSLMADEYLRLLWRHWELMRLAPEKMQGFDGWVVPSTPLVPMTVAEAMSEAGGTRLMAASGRTTRQVNLFNYCSTSTPVQQLGSSLPVGLQTICPGFAEPRALSIALLLESLLGQPPRPPLDALGAADTDERKGAFRS